MAAPAQLAVVTGAAQGIGKTIADDLAAQGTTVIRLDKRFVEMAKDDECLSSVENMSLVKKPTQAVPTQAVPVPAAGDFNYPLDVSDHYAVKQLIERVEREHGAITQLVCAAGILRAGALNECSFEDWQTTFNINTHGVFNVCQAVAGYMRQRKMGSIVVISSNAATTPRMGMGAYAASKAAVSHYVRCLGLELACDQVRCNIVAPGSTDTPMLAALTRNAERTRETLQGSLPNYRVGIPLGRIASPQMISNAALFLLSPAAAHITLQTLTVDGGATLGF
ncbi:MAG: SDR family oxidoreductase [Marinagarivorans sp.]|nr:SDR family oxidoreductase [Marinagarivorans sp.]